MKKYIAQHHKKQFVLLSDDNQEIGRIVNNSNFFNFRHYIIFKSRSYDIKNVGFLKNDVELFNGNGIIYFTDLAKERIVKSGEGVRIYQFNLNKTNQLFEKGKLLIEIKEEKKKFKDSIFHVEVEDSVDDLLTLLFLHYSTKEFNSIGGDGD
ncbi:hypothetical protein [Chryseobacterium sp. MMS23-Vi53]|uniref:hypothetical protein n=1 Tax=Chryseobacterium sp. MMS23-Vi53 TaxID=3386644 RepID=UPI0039EB75F6